MGEIVLKWAKPDQLDTIIPEPTGPFKYIIYRSDDALWNAFRER